MKKNETLIFEMKLFDFDYVVRDLEVLCKCLKVRESVRLTTVLEITIITLLLFILSLF